MVLDMAKLKEGLSLADDVSANLLNLDDMSLFRKILEMRDTSEACDIPMCRYIQLLENIEMLSERACETYSLSKQMEQMFKKVKRVPRKRLL